MKLTVKHKVGGVVCILGAIAVGADRLFILPQQAAAGRVTAERVVTSAGSSGGGVPEIPAGSISTARAAIADRLEAVATQRGFDLEHVPDAFIPPRSWIVEKTPDDPPPGRVTAAQFELDHVLTGVMAVGDGGYAIINGKTLFIGQKLDGFRLIHVSERSAVLDSDDVHVELLLPKEGGSRP